MRVVLSRLFVVLVLLVSGCTDPADTPGPVTGESDAPSSREPQESLAEPLGEIPTWSVGDWWTWSVKPRDTYAWEGTTIVTSASPSKYKVAWNDLWVGLHSQFFHFIPNEEVDATDLTWEAHDVPVKWLDFPLTDGSTWEGGFWITPMQFSVSATQVMTPGIGAEPGFRIVGHGDEGQVGVDILWSPSAKMFTSLTFYLYADEPWMVVDLVEYGTAYVGEKHFVERLDMVIVGTSLLWSVQSRQAPPAIVDIELPSGVTHYSMGCYLGGAPGRYEVALWKDPDERNGCLVENLGTDDEPLQVAWGEMPPGEWRLESTTGGPGQVFVELFLIHVETT